MTRFPDRLRRTWPTIHDFRRDKRAEMDAIIKAFEKFRSGCAYVPGYTKHYRILETTLKHWRKELTVKEWGK